VDEGIGTIPQGIVTVDKRIVRIPQGIVTMDKGIGRIPQGIASPHKGIVTPERAGVTLHRARERSSDRLPPLEEDTGSQQEALRRRAFEAPVAKDRL
jgi:hypothetical protein